MQIKIMKSDTIIYRKPKLMNKKKKRERKTQRKMQRKRDGEREDN